MEQTGEPDLLSLVAVAGTAVPVQVAAKALNASPQSIMTVAARLVREGTLTETAAGYTLPDGSSHDVSPAVAAFLAGHLADAMAENGAEPLEIGRLLAAAGRFAGAWRVLSEAALETGTRRTDAQQLGLLETALSALDEARLDGGEPEGKLRLQLARLYRSRGQTANAQQSLELAVPRLRGEDLIQALGFAASVEDDLQHPQEAERWVALAELVAAQHHSLARLGSLLTFHGRELSRLGFAIESEAAVEKGVALLEQHGSEAQRFYGRLNQAWIDLDQGQMRKAEVGFARLRQEAAALEGEASQATQEAYWARSLFGIGRPQEALESIARALAAAEKTGAAAPAFIAQLAQAEGGILFEQWGGALDGAEGALDLAIASLPSWENVCRYLRARALLGSGRRQDAQNETEAALASTPAGSNGLRWRLRIEELLLELADTWNQSRAEDLTDVLLQSRWLGAAVDLMTARSVREKDPELACEAAALAMQIGNPVQAAKAINSADLWQDPIAGPVAAAIRGVVDRLPEGWEPGFMQNPKAQAAIASEVEVGEKEHELLRAKIEEALASAGLSGEMVLSPAQRRSAGLVRRRLPRRRRPLQWIGATAAVAAIAVVAALAVVNLTAPPPTTTTAATTTTTVLALEETPVELLEHINGSALFRGDPGRSGLATGGFRTVSGVYWRWLPEGELPTGVSAVAFGQYLYLATDQNFLYVLEQRDGDINHRISTTAAVTATPVVGKPDAVESDPTVVFPTADGYVYAYNAIRDVPYQWRVQIGEVRASPLIVDQTVFVASVDGYLHALSLAGGDEMWLYPTTEPAEEFRTAPAYHDGIVYVASREGSLHAITAATGEPICPTPINLRGTVDTNPVIANGVVFVGLEGGGIPAMAAATCGGAADGYSLQYATGSGIRLGLAASPESVYFPANRNLFALSLDSALWVDLQGVDPSPWKTPFDATDIITTPPVMADGVIYFGDLGGRVHAISEESGEPLWGEGFYAGAAVRGETLVVPGAVFVTTSTGEIIAIAGE
ncbi:MAG: PQQ-binding-like beta-propeller repeat protein [Acidimicrobiia bacterium]|nr:PQQ-binding-like beta-propeller repeat protein [Acidimicrobiia bacterium]